MPANSAESPRYDPELVERAILEEVLNLHPQRLTVGELSLRIAGDTEDSLEIETAVEATHSLRASGLVRYRSDDLVVEPTHAALRAAALLGSP